jgi:hypothetical protein
MTTACGSRGDHLGSTTDLAPVTYDRRIARKCKVRAAAPGLAGWNPSVVAGVLFEAEEGVFWVLAILGVIVGLLNVTQAETQSFLLAAIALILSATALNLIPIVGETISQILEYVAAFVAGAMIVVALKALFETGRK